jgi:hypothetical protein
VVRADAEREVPVRLLALEVELLRALELPLVGFAAA